MILFVNVFVSNKRVSKFTYNRYGLGHPNRLDVFKYTLASLSALNPLWSKIILHIELDRQFHYRWKELEAFIEVIFPPEITTLYQTRMLKQKQWQESWNQDLINEQDRFIWYQGNDDHVFIDYDLDYMRHLLHVMNNDKRSRVCSVYSHWPEYIRFSAGHARNVLGIASVFPSFNTDAIQIVSKDVFHDWWFKWNWRNHDCRRSDFIKFAVKYSTHTYVPHRELVRHFDGYSHSMHLPHICPPLHIPKGFFRRNIKILYCGDRANLKPGWTLVNPLLPYYAANKTFGADYRYLLEELPIFWRDRISEIEVAKELPRKMLLVARNRAKLAFFGPHRFTTKILPTLSPHSMRDWLLFHSTQPKL